MNRMPRYIYKCEYCDIIFQKAHSIKEKLVDCEKCDTPNSLRRIPTMPLVLTKKQTEQKREVGSLVKEYIEDVRTEVEEEKRELSNQVYEEND